MSSIKTKNETRLSINAFWYHELSKQMQKKFSKEHAQNSGLHYIQYRNKWLCFEQLQNKACSDGPVNFGSSNMWTYFEFSFSMLDIHTYKGFIARPNYDGKGFFLAKIDKVLCNHFVESPCFPR